MSSSIDNLIDSVNKLTKMTKDGFDSLIKAINNLANQIKEDKSKQ
jgi:flagellar hook-associated protein FlgK